MNSSERKAARFQRRKEKREQKNNYYSSVSFNEIFSFPQLYDAAKTCCNHHRWKSSIMDFETFLIRYVQRIYKELYTNNRHFQGFSSFVTSKKGKTRTINALPMNERVMHKCLCKNFLISTLSRRFINDNYAGLKGKGLSYALKRITKHLSHHYRLYGLEGGIYQFDFKDYFLSLPHSTLKERLRARIKDDQVYELVASFIDDFLYMKGSLYPNEPYGVSLGTEISTILALEFSNPIDHYIKEVLQVHGYGRYMDDGYIISNSLEHLKLIQTFLHQIVSDMGVKLNDKKDKIVPFKNHGFTFLKVRFHIDSKGKIIKRISKKSVTVMRRKLHKFRKWMDLGEKSKHHITLDEVLLSYRSWKSYVDMATTHSYKTIQNMDSFFIKLFKNELQQHSVNGLVKSYKDSTGWHYVL